MTATEPFDQVPMAKLTFHEVSRSGVTTHVASRDTSRSAESPQTVVWRHLRYEVHTGARNMALDQALAESIGGRRAAGESVSEPGDAGAAALRLYGWARPTLSLGRNEPASSYAVDDLRAQGLDVVRRPTGGRAVLHDRELTYAVVVPPSAFGGARGTYVRINEALADGLRHLGAPVEVAVGGPSTGRALTPDAGPCFQVPAVGEVVARGRKIVGSAQARIGGVLLQHGSILLDGHQGSLGNGADGSAPITLRELVGDVSIDLVAGIVAESLRAGLGGEWTDGDISPSERGRADELEATRYRLDSWTLRR